MKVEPLENETPQDFWERHYAARTKPTSGQPSSLLKRFAEGRRPGRALDLGCGRGDDSVWLALQGWQVKGADLSETALATARANAEAEGVADRARFEAHDLEQNLPQGAFDLVTSMFMQSPMDFDRIGILRRASRQIAPGGLLLIGAHAARPSWSEEEGPEPFPSAEEDFAALALDPAAWRVITVGHETRPAKGPEGQEGFHTDSVIALERR